MKRKIIIAIDGPAGAGKSTTARWVAKNMGLLYVDSGAFYRACTLHFLRKRINDQDEQAIVQALKQTMIEARAEENGYHIFLNGEDVTQEIRSQPVTERVSSTSTISQVRDHVTHQLRRIAENKSVVVEGRDIGTVVFQDADLKIFLEADVEERARRRYQELIESGLDGNFEDVRANIENRDEQDSARTLAPMHKAEDAICLDTTRLEIDDVVEFIVTKANEIVNTNLA